MGKQELEERKIKFEILMTINQDISKEKEKSTMDSKQSIFISRTLVCMIWDQMGTYIFSLYHERQTIA